jgi:hypothetical protein
MFYVIETEYVGPNENPDSHTYHIQTCPGRKNMSHEPAVSGWLGTTNDWSRTAHGEFETIQAAQTKIHELTGGKYREQELEESDLVISMDADGNVTDYIVYSVLDGDLEELDAETSQTWCYDSMRETIKAFSSGDEIRVWIQECAHDLAADGGELDEDAVERMAIDYRNELRNDEFYQDAFTSDSSWGPGDFEAFVAECGLTESDPDDFFGQRAWRVWDALNDSQKQVFIDRYNDWLEQ